MQDMRSLYEGESCVWEHMYVNMCIHRTHVYTYMFIYIWHSVINHYICTILYNISIYMSLGEQQLSPPERRIELGMQNEKFYLFILNISISIY
jgi:hypothetical protein